jgi:hypothetical protein
MIDEPAHAGRVLDPYRPNFTADERSVFKEGFQSDPTEAAYMWAWMELAVAFVAGQFCAAFFQALGQRAADSAVKLPKRATSLLRKRIRRQGKPDVYHIGLKGDVSATVVVTWDLSDEARLALIDLDVTAQELRGKLLRWDDKAVAWRAGSPEE